MTHATETLIELHEQCVRTLRKIALAELYRACAQVHVDKGANVEWNVQVVQKWIREKERLAGVYRDLHKEIIELVMNKKPRTAIELANLVFKEAV